MSTPPVIGFYTESGSPTVLSSITLTGSGGSGSVIAGSSSSVFAFRIYNNFANAASIADAVSCDIAAYDDAVNRGAQSTTPVVQQWLEVAVVNYNGTTTGGDGSIFYPIGGATKHGVPVNTGTIGGSAPNYIGVQIQVVVPALASSASISQGLWLEYTYT